MKRKGSRFHTSGSGVRSNRRYSGSGSSNKLLEKTRRRLHSEALSSFLLATPLPSVPTIKSPQRLGVGGLKKAPPLRKRGGLGGFDILSKSVDNFVKTYIPAPTQVGGTTRQSMPISKFDLIKMREEICKDRQTRREVLFAKKLAGRGSKVQNANWTLASLVRCN